MIVPFPAGGPTDIVGRLAAAKAGEILGQQIVVENRTGASGTIGMAATARAKPDGYTVGLATVSTHGTAPHLFPNLAYDPVKDFTPVSNLVTSPNILSVNPQYPAKTLAEFVAHVRANPGKDGYANAGAGGINDLGMIWFLQITGGKMNSISYRGSVSYTHLDVYKRQILGASSRTRGARGRPASGRRPSWPPSRRKLHAGKSGSGY